MRNILVVECASTGINFVQDIIDRNYNPITLELKQNDDSEETQNYVNLLNEGYKEIKSDFEVIHEKDTYEETLEMVREYDPKIIVAGTEKGVGLATRLANDLNLLCNSVDNIDAMTLKDKMQERLAENNLRHIKGKLVQSLDEALEFYDNEGMKEVVLKPTHSAGSVGVKICLNREELIDAARELFNKNDFYGDTLKNLVLQERIKGDEYIVNTVSHNGVHRVTTIWNYGKITTPEGGHIYDYMHCKNELGLGEAEIVEYAYDVADAMGIKYGPVHGEYMVDEKGPVLIEVNCRPMGGSINAEYLDKISGQHETDSILDSYLNPKKFYNELNREYGLYEHGVIKFFIVPNDLVAKSAPINHISNRLKSHYKTTVATINELQPFSKTQDLETSCGSVYLYHEDAYQLQKDLEYLQSIEKNAFQLVLSEQLDKNITFDEDNSHEDITSLLENIKERGTCLMLTDKPYDDMDIKQITPQELKNINSEYDSVVINVNKSVVDTSDDVIVKFVLDLIDKIKVGGKIFIPKSTYDALPSGRLGVESLVKLLGLKIELPLHNFPKILIASKRKQSR